MYHVCFLNDFMSSALALTQTWKYKRPKMNTKFIDRFKLIKYFNKIWWKMFPVKVYWAFFVTLFLRDIFLSFCADKHGCKHITQAKREKNFTRNSFFSFSWTSLSNVSCVRKNSANYLVEQALKQDHALW